MISDWIKSVKHTDREGVVREHQAGQRPREYAARDLADQSTYQVRDLIRRNKNRFTSSINTPNSDWQWVCKRQ